MISLRGIVDSLVSRRQDVLPRPLLAEIEEATSLRISRAFLKAEPARVRFEQAVAGERAPQT